MSRIGYADPPYPGQARRHYEDHPDYDGEVDHRLLLKRLEDEFDGWVLHTSSTALPTILVLATELGIEGYRVMAWVKPFCAFKRNVSVAYAWEPVLVKSVRKPVVAHRVVMRDWFSESIVMKKGLTGVKPERVCHWVFEMLGADPDDEMHDLFPGSGAVSRAWDTWRDSLFAGVVAVPTDPTTVRVAEVRRPVPGARDMTGEAVSTGEDPTTAP